MRYFLASFFLYQFLGIECIYGKADARSVNTSASTQSMTPALDDVHSQAKESILHVYKEARSICENHSLSDDQKILALKKSVQSFFGLESIAKYVIWPHWKHFTDAQRQYFIDLLTNNMANMFYKMARRYLSQLKVLRVDTVKGKENALNIFCEAYNKEDNRSVYLRFQMVKGRIRNILIDNPDGSRGSIDVVQALKADYARLMRKHGNVVDAFLNALESLYGENKKVKHYKK